MKSYILDIVAAIALAIVMWLMFLNAINAIEAPKSKPLTKQQLHTINNELKERGVGNCTLVPLTNWVCIDQENNHYKIRSVAYRNLH